MGMIRYFFASGIQIDGVLLLLMHTAKLEQLLYECGFSAACHAQHDETHGLLIDFQIYGLSAIRLAGIARRWF